METYTLNVAGLTRELPVCVLNDKIDIAAFIMFSDVELTIETAKQLLSKVPEFDIIITAESKGIPLGYEMARQSGKNYIVARKSLKLYMKNPVSVDVKSITTSSLQTLYLSEKDVSELKDKRVLIVDDVISTGESLNAITALVEKAGGNIVCKSAVLAEGNAANRKDIVFLEKLPLIFK